ncbi:hypothetical protein BGZ52_005593 [Haplosporangium bisporale]|nr:hypothetical protein BGZ52_005593 [Haplosporangium bisporale]
MKFNVFVVIAALATAISVSGVLTGSNAAEVQQLTERAGDGALASGAAQPGAVSGASASSMDLPAADAAYNTTASQRM